jgi:hypothetical protein
MYRIGESERLTVNPDHTPALACDDGNGNVVYSKAGLSVRQAHP